MKAGKQIPALLKIKEEVVKLSLEVKNSSGENIISIIEREIP